MDDLRLEDRARIGDLTVAYAYAVDSRDWATFEGLFTPDAVIDYRSAGGISGLPADVAAWMPDALGLFIWTLHSMSTSRITFTGPDTATGDVHVVARHGLTWEGAEETLDVVGVYHDGYVRTAAGWRFAARREQTLSVTGGAFADLLRSSLG
ncbi:MAG: nuclear transport factor 2 family protein [Acidimicrobiales bacterium]|jgi:hypothetical protein|nr:nuclear transport factor 2 family protein [Acidimicrobiales bacterium]